MSEGMSGAELRRWLALEERRRRRGWLAGAWPWAMVAAAVGFAAVARGMGATGGAADPVGTSRTWLAVVVVGHAVVMFGAPFRLFWRRDAALLARLPITGGALYAAGATRGLRAAALVGLPCAVAALGLAAWGDWELALRHLALLGVAAAGAAALAPAAALAAGGLVASDKLEAALRSMGGEFQAPRTSWLGLLPGLAATAMALAVIAGADWAVGAPRTAIGPAAPVLGGSAAACLLAGLWSVGAAGRLMPGALREVSALDRQQLAHVDRSEPSPLERLAARALPPGGRLVLYKDARLARRRHPIPYLVGLVGLLFLAGLAATAPAWAVPAAAATAGMVGVYGAVMARRRLAPPIEHLRYLATLPVAGAEARAAKRTQALLWHGVYLVPGCAVVAARAAAPLTAALVLGAVVAVTLAAALAAPYRPGAAADAD